MKLKKIMMTPKLNWIKYKIILKINIPRSLISLSSLCFLYKLHLISKVLILKTVMFRPKKHSKIFQRDIIFKNYETILIFIFFFFALKNCNLLI